MIPHASKLFAVGLLVAGAACTEPRGPDPAPTAAAQTVAAAPIQAAAAEAVVVPVPEGAGVCGAGGAGCGSHDPVPVAAEVPAAAGPRQDLPGTAYGAGVTLAESTPVSALLADPDTWEGKRVRVEGTVIDVCKKRGCWMSIAGDQPYQDIKVKVTDGVIVFPQEARGSRAVAEGVVRKIPLDLERTRAVKAHEAEEQGRPFDPATVTEPMVLVRLDGLGAVIQAGR